MYGTMSLKCTQESKSRSVMTQALFNKNKALVISKLDLNLRKKIINSYIWIIAVCGAETWILWRVDLKYIESSEMWYRGRMEKISVRNAVFPRVKEEGNIVPTIKRN